MHRDMYKIERRVETITNVFINKRIIPRDASDEETEPKDVDHQREQEEELLEHMPFEEKILRDLEGRMM